MSGQLVGPLCCVDAKRGSSKSGFLLQGLLQRLRVMPSTKKRFNILNGLSGTIRPGRLTLLLGPPSSGKTTLLKALSGKLRGTGLKVCVPCLGSHTAAPAQSMSCVTPT